MSTSEFTEFQIQFGTEKIVGFDSDQSICCCTCGQLPATILGLLVPGEESRHKFKVPAGTTRIIPYKLCQECHAKYVADKETMVKHIEISLLAMMEQS